MAEDVASLGLKIDSSQAAEAAKNLDKLAESGKKAEASFANIERAAKMGGQSTDGYGKALGAAYGIQQQMTQGQIATIRNYETLIGRSDLLSKGMGREAAVFTALRKAGTTGNTEYGQTVAALAGNLYDLEQKQNKTNTSATNFADTLTRRFIMGAIISQIRQMVSAIVNLNAELAKTGDVGRITGIGSQGIQGILGSAANKGIDTGKMLDDMVGFNSQVDLAKTGLGNLGSLFRANGIVVKDTSDAFFRVADMVKNASSEAQKFAILQQAGLPATTQFVKLMEQGANEIKRQGEEAKKLTEEQIAGAQRIDSEFNKLWANFVREGKAAIVDVFDPSTWEITRILKQFKGLNQGLTGVALPTPQAPGGIDESLRARGLGNLPSGAPKTVDPERQKLLVSRAQQELALLGQTTSAMEARRAVELSLQQAGLNGLHIDKDRAEALKQLAYENALGITQIKASTDALNVEAATMGMSAGQAAAYSAVQNKINEARRNGQPLLDSEIAQIEAQARALGNATQKLDTMRSTSDLLSGGIKDFKNELMQGKTAMEALGTAAQNVLSRITDKLIDMAAQKLIQNAIGGGTGGAGGGLLSFLFPSGPSAASQANAATWIPAPVGHLGNVTIGNPSTYTSMRMISPVNLDTIPRHHTGAKLGSDEQLFVGKNGEEVGWPSQFASKYGGRSGSTNLQVKLINQGAPVELASQRMNSDGELELTMRAVARDEMGSSRTNGIQRQKYGQSPRVKAR